PAGQFFRDGLDRSAGNFDFSARIAEAGSGRSRFCVRRRCRLDLQQDLLSSFLFPRKADIAILRRPGVLADLGTEGGKRVVSRAATRGLHFQASCSRVAVVGIESRVAGTLVQQSRETELVLEQRERLCALLVERV